MSAGQGAGMTRRELLGWLRPRPAAVAASTAEAPAAVPPPSPGPPRLASVSAAAIGARLPPMLVPAVLEHACLATTSMCSVCVERCPCPGAIVVTGGRPHIVPEACDGCGRCLAVCPAPVMAFSLVPRTSPRPRTGASR